MDTLVIRGIGSLNYFDCGHRRLPLLKLKLVESPCAPPLLSILYITPTVLHNRYQSHHISFVVTCVGMGMGISLLLANKACLFFVCTFAMAKDHVTRIVSGVINEQFFIEKEYFNIHHELKISRDLSRVSKSLHNHMGSYSLASTRHSKSWLSTICVRFCISKSRTSERNVPYLNDSF